MVIIVTFSQPGSLQSGLSVYFLYNFFNMFKVYFCGVLYKKKNKLFHRSIDLEEMHPFQSVVRVIALFAFRDSYINIHRFLIVCFGHLTLFKLELYHLRFVRNWLVSLLIRTELFVWNWPYGHLLQRGIDD